MIVYPAIDISKGEIVRLTRGNFSKKKIYNTSFSRQVKSFQNNGADWIHVIDLDGALSGESKNEDSVKKVLENTECKVQLGGGIRTLKDIEKWILLGVNRVIIGTSAITDAYLVKEAVKIFPNKVSVGLDLLDDFVAIRGWTEVVKEKKAEYFFKSSKNI